MTRVENSNYYTDMSIDLCNKLINFGYGTHTTIEEYNEYRWLSIIDYEVTGHYIRTNGYQERPTDKAYTSPSIFLAMYTIPDIIIKEL